MLIKTAKKRLKQLLCYISVLSLVFSMTGKIYAADSSES